MFREGRRLSRRLSGMYTEGRILSRRLGGVFREGRILSRRLGGIIQKEGYYLEGWVVSYRRKDII